MGATLRKFFAAKTKRFTWTSEDGGGRSLGKMVIISDGPLLGKGGRSRNPYLWWHNTWTALHSYVTFTWWYNRMSNWYMYIQVLIDNWICSIKGWMSDLFRRGSHSGNSQQAKSRQVNGHTNISSIYLYFNFTLVSSQQFLLVQNFQFDIDICQDWQSQEFFRKHCGIYVIDVIFA